MPTTPRRPLIALALTLCALLAAPSLAHANGVRGGGNLGLGIGDGTNSWGLSLKYFMGGSSAFQMVAGYSYGGIGASLDYLLEMPLLVQTPILDLGWELGVGGSFGVDDDYVAIGASGILGIEFILVPLPLELALEWRPTLVAVPGIDPEFLEFGAHLRVFF